MTAVTGRATDTEDVHTSIPSKTTNSSFLSSVPRFPKEHCFVEGSQIPPVCPSGTNNVYMKVTMEDSWNDTDSGKLKYREKNLSQCNFVHQKSHVD